MRSGTRMPGGSKWTSTTINGSFGCGFGTTERASIRKFSALAAAPKTSSVTRRMSELYAGWLEASGIPVPRVAGGAPAHPIEISPLRALDAESLRASLPAHVRVDGPLYLD